MRIVGSYIRKHWILASFFILTLLCYLSVLIPPSLFWPAIFTSYAIPGLIIFNFLLLIGTLIYRRVLAIFPFFSLVLGSVFVLITFSNKGQETEVGYDLSMLSYNVRFFLTGRHYRQFTEELMEWVAKDSFQ